MMVAWSSASQSRSHSPSRSRTASTTLRTRSRRSSRRGARGRDRRSSCRRSSTCWARCWSDSAVADTIAGIVTVAPDEAVAVIGSGARERDGMEPAHLVARAAVELGSRARRRSRRRRARRGGGGAGQLGRARRLATGRRPRSTDRACGLARARASGSASDSPDSPRGTCAAPRAGSDVRSAAPSGACRLRSPSATARTTPRRRWGSIAALLLATGHIDILSVPLWVKLACGIALTLGTAMGGWRIVRTIGRRIFHLAPIDGLASQTGSTAVILPASYVGAPVSTTQVVASSVVGVGGGRGAGATSAGRWSARSRIAWLLTLPGHGRARGGYAARLEGDSGEHRALVPAGDARRARDAPRADGDHGRGDGCARSLGQEAIRRRATACATASIGRTITNASCGGRSREAFMTPLEPEDLFELSRGLDEVLNAAKNAVREAEVMGTPPTRRSRRWPASSPEGSVHRQTPSRARG